MSTIISFVFKRLFNKDIDIKRNWLLEHLKQSDSKQNLNKTLSIN